jgi:thioredoxin 1
VRSEGEEAVGEGKAGGSDSSGTADTSSAAVTHRPLVACLCAAWCGTCRDYRVTFDAVAKDFPGHAFKWIDIEDESALFDDIDLDLDIETFPTIAIVHDESLRFFGPVLPQAGALARLIEASRHGRQAVGVDEKEAGVLAKRLARLGEQPEQPEQPEQHGT